MDNVIISMLLDPVLSLVLVSISIFAVPKVYT